MVKVIKKIFVYLKYFVVFCGMETYNLKLPQETLEGIKAIAKFEGRKDADMIRRIIDFGLSEYKLQAKELNKLKQEKGIKI